MSLSPPSLFPRAQSRETSESLVPKLSSRPLFVTLSGNLSPLRGPFLTQTLSLFLETSRLSFPELTTGALLVHEQQASGVRSPCVPFSPYQLQTCHRTKRILLLVPARREWLLRFSQSFHPSSTHRRSFNSATTSSPLPTRQLPSGPPHKQGSFN